MLKIIEDEKFVSPVAPYGYIQKRNFSGYVILPFTRWLRARYAESYMKPSERHLDIGCGDCYFLNRSRCIERIGLDKLLGDDINDTLDFPDAHFDYVTLLAVLEHLGRADLIFKEIARILKPSGTLIITTPKKAAHRIIKLYAKDIRREHVSYYDLAKIKDLSRGLFEVADHRTFLFGLNQIFCLIKLKATSRENGG